MLANDVKDRVVRFEIEWDESVKVVVYPDDPDYDLYDEYEPSEEDDEEAQNE